MRVYFKDVSGADVPEMKEKWMDHPPSTGDVVLFGDVAYKVVRREWQIQHPRTECTAVVVPNDIGRVSVAPVTAPSE